MTPAARLIKLFDYDAWANHKILNELQKNDSFENQDRALAFLNHIIGSQHHWYRRVTRAELHKREIWPSFPVGDCKDLIDANRQRWLELIEEESNDLDQTISYENSKGIQHESVLSDILHHLIIHGQHHRSQIALLLRQADIAPPGTDFIFFTRET